MELQLPLDNVRQQCLIEASAGTGKTFTIAALYLQLLAQEKLTVEQILVVTFTKAATAELRQRIRQRITDLLLACEQGSDEALLNDILALTDDVDDLKQRLQLALLDFDQAAVFTIHGFCQRVLQDYAFIAGESFALEITPNSADLQLQLTEDYWRNLLTTQPDWWLQRLQQQYPEPASLLISVLPGLSRSWAQAVADDASLKANDLYEQALQQWLICADLWDKHKDDVEDLLQSPVLNGNKYRKASVAGWIQQLDTLFENKQLPLVLFDKAEKLSNEGLIDGTKKGKTTPEHKFFDQFSSFIELYAAFTLSLDAEFVHLRYDLLQFLRQKLPELKQAQGLASFDDLLLRVQDILNSRRSDVFKQTIQTQYHAALIDEFQDTDPLQYDIFARLFKTGQHSLYFVGDPKQAIYSFRGADIHAYLNASDALGVKYGLVKNWRSTSDMLAACNAFFDLSDDPFANPKIGYPPAIAADKNHPEDLQIEGQPAVALELWQQSEKMNSSDGAQWCAEQVAAEIARLLQLGITSQATLNDRPLKASDIAVLVQSHQQVSLVQHCLAAWGISCSTQSRLSVFESEQARCLQLLLAAVIEPQSSKIVFAWLSTQWMTLTAEQLYVMNHEQGYGDWFVMLQQAADICWRFGPAAMFRSLDESCSLSEKARQLPDGERALTNFRHLLVLLQEQALNSGNSPQKLHDWLAQQRLQSEHEQALLQLESDQQLVKVLTIHISKGLEYPIVFCPFLWKGRKPAKTAEVAIYHQQDQTKIDLGTANFSAALLQQQQDEQQEQLRLLYVALTRAVYSCYLIWGDFTGRDNSALAHFMGDDDTGFNQLLAADNGFIRISQPEEITPERMDFDQQQDALRARAIRHYPAAAKRMSSFSALAVHHGQNSPIQKIENPDHDADVQDQQAEEDVQPVKNAFSFPRGAQAGSCLHDIFEHWDFSCNDKKQLRQLADSTLEKYSIDLQWSSVAVDIVLQTLATSLDNSGLRLQQVETPQRLAEMGFHFPVSQLNCQALQQLLIEHYAGQGEARMMAIRQLNFDKVTGYLKGFIDLIVEHDGRFHIIDYKSNHLGDEHWDYQQQDMEVAVLNHHYYLQYLLYTVALHRYLQWRKPDYDFDCHMGNVYYLFIRGMTPTLDTGVYFDKPDKALVLALDKLMDGAL